MSSAWPTTAACSATNATASWAPPPTQEPGEEARHLAFTPAQVQSPLAGRPYDLRHAALSTWLNAGISAAEVSRRAGNSVEVLLRRYAGCLDNQEEAVNRRIERALDEIAEREAG